MPRYRIDELKGGETLADPLRQKGIDDATALLEAAGQETDREALAEELGVESRTILELCNRADLVRINGVARVYSDLLEFAGVDTVMELAQRNPDNLYATMKQVSGQHFVQRLPRLEAVHDWVAQAKAMGRKVFY